MLLKYGLLSLFRTQLKIAVFVTKEIFLLKSQLSFTFLDGCMFYILTNVLYTDVALCIQFYSFLHTFISDILYSKAF